MHVWVVLNPLELSSAKSFPKIPCACIDEASAWGILFPSTEKIWTFQTVVKWQNLISVKLKL